MSSTATVYISSTTSQVIPPSNDPPIVEFARILGHTTSVAFSFFSSLSVFLARIFATPLRACLQLALYSLAPVTLLLRIVFDALVLKPRSLLLALIDNLYPLYVFVGVACICAAFIGLSARICVNVLRYFVVPPKSRWLPSLRRLKRKSLCTLGHASVCILKRRNGINRPAFGTCMLMDIRSP
ncbi:hypothetical protein A0H81_07698 [Grifola frondosa]|uniref:Uncharacterized protein n=1 Tax=Grifola frondosa TaxID=5627 RepID=A0A1C7M5S3_GRIFR|nr:hypothetical protein A0H81_07698 [Grifola frondosa]